MAIDTTFVNGSPGIAMMATESFASAEEPRYGDGESPTTVRNVTVAADLTLPIYSVIAISPAGVLSLSQFGQAASKVLTFSGPGTAADTITIDSVVYTLRAAPTTVANEVKIGATAAATAANLAAAIMGTGVPGTDYGSLTVKHPTVVASANAADVTVTAKTPGNEGNSIAIAESGTNTSWAGAATNLSGGAEDPDAFAFGILAAPIVMTSGQYMDIPVYRGGHWNAAGLNWHASYDSDHRKRRAFEKSLSPNIFVSVKKFTNQNVVV